MINSDCFHLESRWHEQRRPEVLRRHGGYQCHWASSSRPQHHSVQCHKPDQPARTGVLLRSSGKGKDAVVLDCSQAAMPNSEFTKAAWATEVTIADAALN